MSRTKLSSSPINSNPAARPPTCWQVAAGSGDRGYADMFLRYGLAFVGGEDNIRRMGDVRAGDRIVLKHGKTAIAAVGMVTERDGRCGGHLDKAWLRDFDGWDLPAYCFVRWHVPPAPIEVAGLTRTTINKVQVPEILAVTDRLLKSLPPTTATLTEPAPTRQVTDDEILEFLIRHGLRPADADDLTAALRRIRLMARYYYKECDWDDVREHETRTFLILPLLLALGWPEQRLKVELGVPGQGRIDVAGFARPYRRDDTGQANNQDCVLILESKGFHSGLDGATPQAHRYAEQFPSCNAVVVSNGFCYKVFSRKGGTFSPTPSAYLNLLNPQDAYPLDPVNVKGCLAVLEILMPG